MPPSNQQKNNTVGVISGMSAVEWVAANRGKMTEIAKATRVTSQFVHLVLRGKRKSTDGRVERALREVGAPCK